MEFSSPRLHSLKQREPTGRFTANFAHRRHNRRPIYIAATLTNRPRIDHIPIRTVPNQALQRIPAIIRSPTGDLLRPFKLVAGPICPLTPGRFDKNRESRLRQIRFKPHHALQIIDRAFHLYHGIDCDVRQTISGRKSLHPLCLNLLAQRHRLHQV